MQSGFYRSIVNTIASVPKLGLLKMTVAYNKTGYASCYLVLNGQDRPEWALSWAEQSKMIDVTKDKKGQTVATDAEELITKLVELASKVEVDTSVSEIEPTASEIHESLLDDISPNKSSKRAYDDDLPF